MSKAQNKNFLNEFEMFKMNHNPDCDLKNIFEIYLPFWFCRQNVIIEKDVEIDRFSKIILQTLQSGFTKHSDICQFLGIEKNSFVTSQFHFLLKNGLLIEIPLSNDTEYQITLDGLSFLERKKKITNIETVEFDYFYNDLTLEFLDKQKFDFILNDLTKDFVDTSKPFDNKNISAGKRKRFSGYIVQQTKDLVKNGVFLKEGVIEVKHKNQPYNLNKVDFANFFNKQYKDSSFYDFESNDIEAHKRSICFLALEYEDKAGLKTYDIRHFKKTVKEFDRHEIEEGLTKKTTEYLRKTPLSNPRL